MSGSKGVVMLVAFLSLVKMMILSIFPFDPGKLAIAPFDSGTYKEIAYPNPFMLYLELLECEYILCLLLFDKDNLNVPASHHQIIGISKSGAVSRGAHNDVQHILRWNFVLWTY